MSKLINSRLRKTLKKVTQPQTGWMDVFPAVIGKADGTILTGVDGLIYARNFLNGQVITVYNFTAPNIAGLQVEIGRKVETPGLWQVKGVRETYQVPAGGSIASANHSHDNLFISRDRFLPFLIFPITGSGFLVQVYGDVIAKADGSFSSIASQQLDLSAHVPASGALYVLIEADEDGTLYVTDGTAVDAKELLTLADIPAITTGRKASCAVRLYAEQAQLYRDPASINDFVDLRAIPTMPTQYTDEMAQDAIGGILDNATIGDIEFTYDDATPKISGRLLGGSWKHYVKAASIYPFPLPAYTPSAGSKLTGNATGQLEVDGIVILLDDYVLVGGETSGNQKYNGLYKCTIEGAVGVAYELTRADEMNSSVSPQLFGVVPVGGTGDMVLRLYAVYSSGSYTIDVSNVFVSLVYTDMVDGQNASKIANGSVSNTEFQYLNGVTSALQTQLDGKVDENVAISSATKTKITYDAKGLVTAGADIALSDIPTPKVGTPTAIDTMDEDYSTHFSSGVSNGTLTYVEVDTGSHKVKVNAGTGYLRTSNSQQGVLVAVSWSAVTQIDIPAPAAGQETTRFIGIEYNSGSPQVTTRTAFDWNWYTDFPLARVSYDGTTLRILNAYAHAEDTANLARRYLRLTMPFIREEAPEGSGGLEISEVATRQIAMSAGNIWHGFNRYLLSAVAAGTAFDTHYRRSGGGFNSTTGVTQYPNTQYDDGSGTLATMTNNKYACLWVFLDVSDGSLDVVYGRDQYNSSALAQAETVPTTPAHLTYHGRLLGRIVFQKSAASATAVESAWTSVFMPTAVSDHSLLSNLQGGTAGEYYHLTAAQYAALGTGGGTPSRSWIGV